ncbi:MAG TPA: nucleoside triphosphate pyrophosphohydrolase [Alphaproteobacteria bacterium]|nr:nucleoside triphosphate pyrophosphohydrolase [Alphaproteobacteria bacterium]
MDSSPSPIRQLLDVMARLRDKETGCPWDIEQDFRSIAPCTIEEAYEVSDAIERGDMEDFKEELGDLLLQVVFHSQMAKEELLFEFDDVVERLIQKLVSRHPHVFGDETAKSAEDVLGIWQQAKDKEKQDKGNSPPSILDDIPMNFPALMRAQKISKKAAKSGFEWTQTEDVIDKIIEELNEFRAEIKSGDKNKQAEELGDVFFTLVNLGRRLDIDCEEAMRACNSKFYRRFSGMERDIAADGKSLSDLSAEEWEIYWQKQKAKE